MSHDYPQDGPFPDFGQRNQRGMAPNMEPPILAHYPDIPVYDANTLVTLVKVRPITLWSWEQQLGISSGETSPDTEKRRQRSERDLVALLWIKEMVIAGESSQEAAARLIAAQRGQSGTGVLHSGALNSGALSTGALNPAAFGPSAPRRTPGPTGSLSSPTYPAGYAGYPDLGASGAPNAYPTLPPAMSPNTSGLRPTPDAAMMHGGTGAQWTSASGAQWSAPPRYPAPDLRAGGPSGVLAASVYPAQPQMGGQSGRLGGVFSGSLEAPTYPQRGMSQSQTLNSLRELRPSIAQLLQSFARFDTARANAVLMEALRAHGVETVCVGLVQPAAQRVGELWSKSELTNPEERFALNYLRTFMHSVYHSTPEPLGAPLAVVGCAPNESSDFGALLLAVLWRRAGLRVVYLGRGIDGDQLTQQTWPIPPSIVALTATTSQRLRALARINKRLAESLEPQPIFAYWGPVFVRNPELRRKLNAVYLGDDVATATRNVRELLNMDAYE